MSKSNPGRPPIPSSLPSPVVDSHCHLDVVDRHLRGSEEALGVATALQRAASVNVTRVVQVGCDVVSSQWAASVADEHESVIAAVALHPNDAARLGVEEGLPALAEAIEQIEGLLNSSRVRAVGETGLDYFRTTEEGRPAQHESFRQHIELAKTYDKTLVIHDRDSHEDVIRILLEQGAPDRVVFHCFSGDEQMALTCAANDWYCSFAGVVTFPSAQPLRAALGALPRQLVLVETDAPYLTPVPHRGRVNASYLIPHTVEVMAATRGETVDSLCEALWHNSMRAFGDW